MLNFGDVSHCSEYCQFFWGIHPWVHWHDIGFFFHFSIGNIHLQILDFSTQSCYVVEEITLGVPSWVSIEMPVLLGNSNWLNHLWGVVCCWPRMRIPNHVCMFIGKRCFNSSFFRKKLYVSCRINLPEGAIMVLQVYMIDLIWVPFCLCTGYFW